jgi:hypothetical protein
VTKGIAALKGCVVDAVVVVLDEVAMARGVVVLEVVG